MFFKDHDNKYFTPKIMLHEAFYSLIDKGDIDTIFEIYNKSQVVEFPPETAYRAALKGNLELVKSIENVVDIKTPETLIGACLSGNIELVYYLLSEKNCITTKYATFSAANNGYFEILKLLVMFGVEWDLRLPFKFAANNEMESLQTILSFGCPWPSEPIDGAGPIEIAELQGFKEMAEFCERIGCPRFVTKV